MEISGEGGGREQRRVPEETEKCLRFFRIHFCLPARFAGSISRHNQIIVSALTRVSLNFPSSNASFQESRLSRDNISGSRRGT